jgi:membrane protein DedA with SNARE-associated domain
MWLFAWVVVNQGGLPIPVVPSLIAAGALAAAGRASLSTVIALIVGASLVADLLWYGIGRWAHAPVLGLLGRLSDSAVERVKTTQRRFVAHGMGFVLCCRFVPEVNPVAAATAGAAHVAPGRYMLVATVSALGWAGTWTGFGYALYQVNITPPPAAQLTTFTLVIGVIASAALAVRRWRRTRSWARVP